MRTSTAFGAAQPDMFAIMNMREETITRRASAGVTGGMIRVAFGAFVVSMVAAVALGRVGGVSTQEQYRLSVDQVIVADDSESLTALVTILDAAGKPVPGLTTFHASIDGGPPVAPHSVEATLSEDVGIAVLLLVDVSG